MPTDPGPLPLPIQRYGGGGDGQLSAIQQAVTISNRSNAIITQNPYMAEYPATVRALASQPKSTDEILDTAAASYGMMHADTIINQLRDMSPGSQRAVFNRLGTSQRMALEQQGYSAPERDDDGFLDFLGPAGTAISAVTNVIGSVVEPVASPLLKGLIWVGDQPAHLYRAARLLDDAAQTRGLFGAVAGAAVGYASRGNTGGTFRAFGQVGVGAVGGLTAGAALPTSFSLQNPTDWWRAFNDSWNGERTFDRPSQRKAKELLADPRLMSAALDMAFSEVDLDAFARDFAEKGTPNPADPRNADKFRKMAERLAPYGTPEFQKALDGLTQLAQDPKFQEAVRTLQNGKISVGRDFADGIGLDPGSGVYNVVSGAVDATWIMAVDPTLMLGGVAHWRGAARRGMQFVEGGDNFGRFHDIQQAVPAVMRAHLQVADAVAKGDMRLMRQVTKNFKELGVPLLQYADQLVEAKTIGSRAEFTIDHFNDYMKAEAHMIPLLAGRASVKGEAGLILAKSGSDLPFLRGLHPATEKSVGQRFTTGIRSFGEGLSDPAMEKRVTAWLNDGGRETLETWNLPPDLFGELDSAGRLVLPWNNIDSPGAYMVGRALGQEKHVSKFVGDLFASMTTMIPKGKSIAIEGDEMIDDIHSFVETLRIIGMPSWMRKQTANTILDMGTAGERAFALNGVLANAITLTGARSLAEGRELLEAYGLKSDQAFGLGGIDGMGVGDEVLRLSDLPSQMAGEIVIPDLYELRKAASTGYMAKALMGISNAPVIEPFLTKVWKPAVLMRIGFIPRAAGEEFVNFMLRGGVGGLAQEFGARSVGRFERYSEALRRRDAGGFELDALQLQLLKEGPLPAHIRPLGRMLDRQSWGHPMKQQLENYGEWLRGGLDRRATFGPFVGERPTSGNLPLPRMRTAGMPLADEIRLNIANRSNAILLGNPRSWRRMALGGVNDDLLEAGNAFYDVHSRALMSAVGSTNAGIYDRGYNSNDVRTIRGKDGVDIDYKPVMGRWERFDTGVGPNAGPTDPYALNALHDRAAEIIHDYPEAARVARRVEAGAGLSRVEQRMLYGQGDKAGQWRAMYHSHDTPEARLIIDEFLGAPHYDSFKVMLSDLGRINPDLAKAIRLGVPDMGMPLFDDVMDAVDDYARTAKTKEARKVRAQLDENGRDLVRALNQLETHINGTAKRRYVGQQLKGGSGEKRYKSWADAKPDGVAAIASQMSDARHQHKLMRSKRMTEATSARRDRLAREYVDAVAGNGFVGTPSRWGVDDEADRTEDAISWLRGQTNLTERERAMLAEIDARKAKDAWYPMDPEGNRASWLTEADDRGMKEGRRYDAHLMARDNLDSAQLAGELAEHIDRRLPRGSVPTSALRDGERMLYVPPRIGLRLSDDAAPTVQDLANMADNPGVILRNTETVETLIAHDLATADGIATMLANRALADELTIATARWKGIDPNPESLRTVMFPESILTSKVEDMHAPIGAKGDAWSIDRGYIETRLAPVDQNFDALVQAQAERVWELMRQRLTKGIRETPMARGIPRADGGKDALLFRQREGGGLEPIEPGTPVRSATEDIRDKNGVKINYRDHAYYEPEGVTVDPRFNQEGDVMWELAGPIFEDLDDARRGTARLAPKHTVFIEEGQTVPTGDTIRVWRSKVAHVQQAGAGVPNVAIGEYLEAIPKKGWDNFVRQGFDRVIGPAIDALARKPMAFHFFAQRYTEAKRGFAWTLDPEVLRRTGEVVSSAVSAAFDPGDVSKLAGHSRALARLDGETRAAQWSDAEALGWLRSHSEDDLLAAVTRAETRAGRGRWKGTPEGKAAKDAAKFIAGREIVFSRTALHANASAEDFLAYAKTMLPEGALESKRTLEAAKVREAIKANPVLRTIDADGWETIRIAERQYAHVREEAAATAATAAIGDMMPFIDSHELKTQFAEMGKGFLPFWYAEENFMRRWARTIAYDPTSIRKAQLGYMGLKEAGVVQTDPYGRDWFYYPGSGVLAETVGLIPGMDTLPVGAMFGSPTETLLPGLNNRFGAPSFSPIIAFPLKVLAGHFPEFRQIENALTGGIGMNRAAWESILPSVLSDSLAAMTADESTQSYASAMMAAAAQMEIQGDGPPDTADAGQINKWMDRLRQHARAIMVSKAVTRFFAPGAPVSVTAGETASVTGLGVESPRAVLSKAYYTLVADLGVEQGMIRYLELYPNAGFADILNPESAIAATVGMSVSPSGAPLPTTADAANFYRDNSNYFDDYPWAAPWLLPNNPMVARDADATSLFDEMTIYDLRDQRTPEDFYRAMKFKEASGVYFRGQDTRDKALAEAEAAGNTQLKKEITAAWDEWAKNYKATHPVFRDELESGKGRERRETVMSELRVVMADPKAPRPPHFDVLARVVRSFDRYLARLTELGEDRSNQGDLNRDAHKAAWGEWLTGQETLHPEIAGFIQSVVRPDSRL